MVIFPFERLKSAFTAYSAAITGQAVVEETRRNQSRKPIWNNQFAKGYVLTSK